MSSRQRHRAGHRRVTQWRRRPAAFTLLEIILALAILSAAIAILGEAVRQGYRNAAQAQQITLAELHAASKMAEITSGILLPEPVQAAQLETDPEWLYSIDMEPLEWEGLAVVRVTVRRDLPPVERPAEFTLTRWIPDPGVELPVEELESLDASPPSEGSNGS